MSYFDKHTPSLVIALVILTALAVYMTVEHTGPTIIWDTHAGTVYWRGDFETGNLSQWTYNPLEGTGRTTVGTSANQPVKQGTFSGKFIVTPNSSGTSNDRAELNASQAQTGGYPGQDWYYGWWTYIPTINSRPQQWQHTTGDHNDIAQFQSVDWTAWLYIGVDQGNYTPGATSIFMNWGGKPGVQHAVLRNPLQYDHWYNFVLHAKWSTDPTVGFVEVYVDGQQAFRKTFGATLYNTTVSKNRAWTAPGVYAELDLYRGAYTSTNIVYHDGFCRADTYAAAAGC